RLLFQFATIAGILTLLALLYNILNQTFGYAAVENEVDPATVVRDYEKGQMLSAAALSSEDDARLAAAVADDPLGVALFSYSAYLPHAGELRLLAIDGAQPGGADYPLNRPLFLYSAVGVAQQKPQVAAFVHYYLAHATEAGGEAGV